ncbi:MAG: alpha-L-rhamnosidase C-terminal domain-containing protein [Parabacteroides sp.]
MHRITGIFVLCGLILFANSMKADSSNPWKARWISSEHTQSMPNTWLAFRKTAKINAVPQTLIARIAADSKYWLWINGKMVVYEGGLKRGPSPFGTYYDKVDIAPYLVAGDNTIAVLLWHFGKNGFSHLNSGTAALLFDAEAPGVEILSDADWECKTYDAYENTDAPFPNYRLSESNIRFDGRLEMPGWNQPGFDKPLSSSSNIVAAAGGAPFGALVERPVPMFKDYGLKNYINIRKSASGDTLYCRLPYNCQATPYLKVEAEAGDTIRMQTDNYLIDNVPSVRAEYITRKGLQEYESYGWMNGNEIRYVIPEGVKVVEVKYRETGYDTEFNGHFSCSDPYYTELWKRASRTLYVTMRDNYMDCPDRERAQWWGDETNELGEAFYAFSPSAHKLAAKGILELAHWQHDDGTMYAPVPAGNWAKELPLQSLASVGWYGFYTQYYYSGDSSFVSTVYDRLHRYLHDVWQLDRSGLVVERTSGWSWGDWGENIDMGVLTQCWYYLAMKAEKAFALQLGKAADAEEDAAIMQTLEKCFNNKYWTGTAYRSPGYKGETDDRSQAMAVVSGLASADKYPSLVKVLKKEYHASPYMEKYVLEALFDMNEPAFALERMKNRYAEMMSYKDYSTLFEGWKTTGGTINHAWSGGPLTLLSQKVCGIVPTSPGFRSFKIAPQLGNLSSASAKVDTHYGLISVNLHKRGSAIAVELTVPEGTTAEAAISKGKVKTFAAGSYTFVIKNK